MRYEHLLGRPYLPGRQDCGAIVRDFYIENFGLTFRDHARPDDWWQKGMNLFYEIYRAEGFVPLDIHLKDIQVADIMLMAYGSSFPNHCGLYVGNGEILQHKHGQFSGKEKIKHHHKNAMVAIVRHKETGLISPPLPEIDVLDILSPYWKHQLMQQMGVSNDEEFKREIERLTAAKSKKPA